MRSSTEQADRDQRGRGDGRQFEAGSRRCLRQSQDHVLPAVGGRSSVSFFGRTSASYPPSKDQCIPKTARWLCPGFTCQTQGEGASGSRMVHTGDRAEGYPGWTSLTVVNIRHPTAQDAIVLTRGLRITPRNVVAC